jgi:hypothetical protein
LKYNTRGVYWHPPRSYSSVVFTRVSEANQRDQIRSPRSYSCYCLSTVSAVETARQVVGGSKTLKDNTRGVYYPPLRWCSSLKVSFKLDLPQESNRRNTEVSRIRITGGREPQQPTQPTREGIKDTEQGLEESIRILSSDRVKNKECCLV